MQKSHVILSAAFLSVGLLVGLSLNTPAMSDATSGVKIGVVDVNAVVAQSAQVKNLKKEEEAKRVELDKWLKTVKSDIDKQSTKENKEKLLKKYDAEFVKKQSAHKEAYQKKLTEIDKSISTTINEQAKARGYNIVLTKNSVLYGGDDSTQAIIKVVK